MTYAIAQQLITQAKAENWEELDLAGLELEVLPPEIGELTQLKRLVLGKLDEEKREWVGNRLMTLPDELSQLRNLEELSVAYNRLTEIPEFLGNLTNLTVLHLWENQIKEIPESLSKLTNLTVLHLWGNQIKEIPESLSKLTNLTELYLGGNQIKEIPEFLGNLTNLTGLYLSGKQIKEIPEFLGNLTNLTGLHLSGNQIKEIPEFLGNLTNLTGLYLIGNQIKEIPEFLKNLTNLKELYLSENQIKEIPEFLGNLTNLTELYLSKNQIKEIPEFLGNLTNLTKLSLGENQIKEIPEFLSNLTNLTGIHLHENQIKKIPEFLSNLTNLTWLFLGVNQIKEIPEFLGNLTNLTVLHLDRNQIKEIPESLGKLEKLERLELSHNQITDIPQTLQQLKVLKDLDLQANPISIPPEILSYKSPEKESWQSPDAQPILDYYFTQRDPNETQTIYEAKLLLVGEGGSGKTSLANKILNPDYQLKPETEDTSTEGIDILKWEFTTANKKQYRINIWDFGGQEIYHQTHQFFLTQRSLYLLVADSRKEDTDHYFWLEIIRLLSNNSPVLLIQNEKQDRTCNLNLNQLRGEFANLRDTFTLNLANNRGLTELQNELQHQLEKLIPNGIPFPNKWFAVRYTLENDGRNYIEYSEYQNTCRRHGITNRDEMCLLSQFLHDLGICLHFQNDPILSHRLILKPNWGTTAVYKILDNDKVKQNLGQFNDQDLAEIWSADEYADMRYQLLQLMKEFKVCYEIPRRKGEYIAPHLLSPESPSYQWHSENNLLLRYNYNFMPKGILTRFIVEMHQDIENVSDPENALVWKNGVILKDNSTRAEIVEYYHSRKITIRVAGNRPRDLMTIINRKFQEIHDSFDGLKYDTLIPCNCQVCQPSQKPFTFPLNRLYYCLDRNRFTIECHESGEDVEVRGLIDGVINEYSDYPEFAGDYGEGLMRKPGRSYRSRYREKLDPPQPPFTRGEKLDPLTRGEKLDPPQPPFTRGEKLNSPLTRGENFGKVPLLKGDLGGSNDRERELKNFSVNVLIHNHNQQEQTMNNDKIWHGDRVEGSKIGSINSLQGSVGDIHGNNIVNNYNDTDKQSLAEAAKEIQELMEQLATTYNTDSMVAKVEFAGEIVKQIDANPNLGGRILSASKAGGVAALGQFLNHPLASFAIAALEDWQKTK